VPSPADRRAAALLLLLAAAGVVVRFWRPPAAAPGAVAYRAPAPRASLDSVAARAQRLARPLARGERIDLDRAPVEELARLPRIGPALAARIATYRDEHGPFGSLEALDAVPGVGPSVLSAIRPYAAFSGSPRGPALPVSAEGSPLIEPLPRRSAQERPGTAGGSGSRLRLNTASAADLEALPGIGPALAQAIVNERAQGGPFRSLEDLRSRVRGIGPRLLETLGRRLAVP
jgi:competence ComEA-like helix-hairpin-helix protein